MHGQQLPASVEVLAGSPVFNVSWRGNKPTLVTLDVAALLREGTPTAAPAVVASSDKGAALAPAVGAPTAQVGGRARNGRCQDSNRRPPPVLCIHSLLLNRVSGLTLCLPTYTLVAAVPPACWADAASALASRRPWRLVLPPTSTPAFVRCSPGLGLLSPASTLAFVVRHLPFACTCASVNRRIRSGCSRSRRHLAPPQLEPQRRGASICGRAPASCPALDQGGRGAAAAHGRPGPIGRSDAAAALQRRAALQQAGQLLCWQHLLQDQAVPHPRGGGTRAGVAGGRCPGGGSGGQCVAGGP